MRGRRSFFILLGLALTGAVFLTIETYLNLHGSSLCKTSSCEAVGHYIRFGEATLVKGGAAFFWLLATAVFFARRYPAALTWLPSTLLFAALAFDGNIIGFQVFTIKRFCLLCFSVAAALGVITVTYGVYRNRKEIIIAGLIAWAGGFAGSGIVEMPEPTGAYDSMVITRQEAAAAGRAALTMTLIFSMNCPHCEKVVAYLAEHPLDNVNWRLAAIDLDEKSLGRLDSFLREAPKDENIFSALEKAKKLKTPPKPTIAKARLLTRRARKALTFMGNLGITGIPLLIIEDAGNERTILSGDASIIKALQKRHDGNRVAKEKRA